MAYKEARISVTTMGNELRGDAERDDKLACDKLEKKALKCVEKGKLEEAENLRKEWRDMRKEIQCKYDIFAKRLSTDNLVTSASTSDNDSDM